MSITVRRGRTAADNFTIVSNELLRDNRLSLKARGLGAWLLSHSARMSLSVDRIASLNNVGTTTVKAALRELETSGYLHRQQHVDPETRQMRHSTYMISDTPEFALVEPVGAFPADGQPGEREGDPTKKTTQEEDQPLAALASDTPREPEPLDEKNPPLSSLRSFVTEGNARERTDAGARDGDALFALPGDAPAAPAAPKSAPAAKTNAAIDADFPDWYAAYPRHVGRGQAERAYRTARKLPGVTAQLLLDAAVSFAVERRNEPKEFTPHPATWLNGKRWMDEPAGRAAHRDASAHTAADYGPPSKMLTREESIARLEAMRAEIPADPYSALGKVVHEPPRLT